MSIEGGMVEDVEIPLSTTLSKTLGFAVFILLVSCFWQVFMVEQVKADTVTLTPIADTYLFERIPSYAPHPDEHIDVGRDSGYRDRGLVRFNFSSIPLGSTIDSATLRLYCVGVWGDILPWHVTVYRATFNWTESSTWNSVTPAGGQWSTDNSDTQPIGTAGGNPPPFGWYTWNVTGIVKEWMQNGQPNNGFILVSVDIETAGGHRAVQFSSRHAANPPTLEIDYTCAFNPSLAMEFGNPAVHVASVVVGTEFQVQIAIRNLPSQPSGMENFAFDVLWNPSLIRYVSAVSSPLAEWIVSFDDSQVNSGLLNDVGGFGPSTNIDHIWLTITFRCLGSGDSEISFAESSWLESYSGFTLSFGEEIPCMANQTVRTFPVGGIMEPADNIAMIAPYIAVAGLISILLTSGLPAERESKLFDVSS